MNLSFGYLGEILLGDGPSTPPVNLYQMRSEAANDSWKADDREARSQQRQIEQEQLHDGTYGRYGSDFDPVARDNFYQQRDEYRLVGRIVSPNGFKPTAVIRVPSSNINLHVDLSSAHVLSKRARRTNTKTCRG